MSTDHLRSEVGVGHLDDRLCGIQGGRCSEIDHCPDKHYVKELCAEEQSVCCLGAEQETPPVKGTYVFNTKLNNASKCDGCNIV